MAFWGWQVAKDLFAPFVIAPLVWVAVIILYMILPHNLYPPANRFPSMIVLWSTCFFFSSMWAYMRTKNASHDELQLKPSAKVMNFYYILTITLMPVVIGLTIWTAFINDPVNMFRYLRIMSTGVDENVEAPNLGILNYFVPMAYVSLFLGLLYSKKKWLIGVLILLNLLLAFMTMAKTTFLCILLASLYVLYVKKIVQVRHFVYGMLVFLAFSFLLQSVRSAASQDNVEIVESTDFFTLYILTPMSAFEHFTQPASSLAWGENTFRLFYALGTALGLDMTPANTILPFVYVPDETNTYTILYPFYTDFGAFGVFFFAILYGLAYGFLFKKTVTGNQYALILYAMFLNYLILEFIGEFIFTNLSMEIQHLFYATLPFLKLRAYVRKN